MRLQDIFTSPSVAKALDFLLVNPTTYYSQKHLMRALDVDKATMRQMSPVFLTSPKICKASIESIHIESF